ncbi:FAD binding domain-containing protein [Natrinema gelatinilyticum]|uniref:FAD binding domain-containing protein n=1 Tax=Natrinema gelatinilyticum TaxID=2961571 RepID=UPI0020C3D19E|nr:xanthine dehydrogenase family protein subunit M [Natrinema gelatinilyticum]
MHDFKYASPESVEDVCTLLDEHGTDAAIISGGQSLMPMLRLRAAQPECLIDINRLPDRDYVELTDDEIRIGCLARHVDVERSEVVEEHCPVLAEVAAEIGDMQVRNRGTFCGSIAHADPSGDPPVLATLLDAMIVAETVDGTDWYSGDGFYHGFYETDIDKNTLVTEVRFPVLDDNQGTGYEKYEPSEGAYPVATVGAIVRLDDGVVTDVGLVTGAVEPGPIRIPEAEDHLEDQEPTDDRVATAAELAGENVTPVGDHEGTPEFKIEMTKTLAKRALDTAIERAGENE